jgi:hypothetical protein
VRQRRAGVSDVVEEAHGGHPNSFATFWKPVTSTGGR